MARIGFIGLGLMGRPMARRLIEAGHSLKVYNRSRKPVDEMVEIGAVPAGSPMETARGSEFTILMLPDSPDVEEVVLGEGGVAAGAERGSIVIDMSTVSPETERLIYRKLAQRGVRYLDAPVTGGTIGAERGTLVVMAGGDLDAFQASEPILRALGKYVYYMGPSGSGQLAKICNQVSVALSLLGACEALMLASKSGLDARKVVEAVSQGAGSSWQLTNLGPKIIDGDFRPGFKVEHLSKDLRIALEVSQRLSLPLPGAALVHQLLKSLVAKGWGSLGTQALAKVLEELAGHRVSAPRVGADES